MSRWWFFTESDLGPFNMTSDKRAVTKHDTTVSIYPITKYKTVS